MKIEYQNTFLDYLRFTASHQFKNIPTQAFFLFITGLMFYMQFTAEINQGKGIAVPLIASLFLYLMMWLLQFIFNVFYLYSKNNKVFITTHNIEIQDDSFYEETPYNRSYFYWNGITKVIKINGFIAVYPSPHQAVIIPNRAFSTPESREEFYSLVKSKIQKEKG